MARRIGFEAMDTPAACRTYNVLLGEGRAVVAALLFERGVEPVRKGAERARLPTGLIICGYAPKGAIEQHTP
ncbi:MAG: hypothetical protein IPP50_00710 [Piscinibacter sp.]|nr:hypothetical protein [Piscinibacter sp.]